MRRRATMLQEMALEATLAERARISAILQSPEAWLRTRLARHLALETEVAAHEAIEQLRAAPADAQRIPENIANLSASSDPRAIPLH